MIKRCIAAALCFLMVLAITGCGSKTANSIAITNNVTDTDFVYADEEVSPTGKKITIYSSESMGDAEIVLKPVEVKEENSYEPVMLKEGKSVTLDVEKGAWFKVGIRMTDAKDAGKKTLKIKGITVRIASDTERYMITEVIKEINGTVMTMDGPYGCFNVPMENMEASPEPQVGDILEVVYDGRIEELYPSLFPGIYSLKVYKPVEMTGIITGFDEDALYFNPIEFSSLNDCIVTDWMEYIPTGTSFEVGDEIEITYNGNTTEENPMALCGVVKITLTDEGFKRKYGDLISDTVDIPADDDTRFCVCIDGVTYYDTGKETSMGARTVDDSIQIEYAEIPLGGSGAAGTITAFARLEEGKTLACLIDEKWYLFESEAEKSNSLPPYIYSGNDWAEKAIIDYFEENNYLMKPEGSVWIPAFCIFMADAVDPYGGEAKKGDVKVYGNFWSFVYSKQGDTLFCESGGEYPGVVYLKYNGGNDYEVTCFDAVGDGSQYSEDIRRICSGNESLEKQYYNAADGGSQEVKNKRTWGIYKYVKDNGLDIKYYQDYGWDPVDFNMEVNSWGNVILEGYEESMMIPMI